MKKILSAILAAVVMTTALSGCGNTNDESDRSQSSDQSSSVDNSADNSGSASDNSTDSSDQSSGSDDSSSDIGYDTANEYGLELPDSRAGELAAKALAADGWGNMGMLGEDEVSFLISEDLKFDMLDDYCFLYPMITGRKMIFLAAKPKAADEEAVKAIFDAKYDYYKNDPNAAFYLAEKEDVAGTVSGVTNDGYYYVIVHPNGPDIQSAID